MTELNRAFKYGDGLFETIRVINGQAQHLGKHYHRLSTGLHLLQMQPQNRPLSLAGFQEIITNYISTQSDANLRIRITFFRKNGGLYTPQKKDFDYLIEATPLLLSRLELNQKGLHIGVCTKVRLAMDQLSNLKTISALPYVLAGLEKQEKKWDDCLILNAQERIAESIAANVFVVKKKQLFTPTLKEGCVMGVMRAYVIEKARAENYTVVEQEIPLGFLVDAEELFLTNAIQGIQWVESIVDFQQKFSFKYTKKLFQKL